MSKINILAYCHSKDHIHKGDTKLNDLKIYYEHNEICEVDTNDIKGIDGDIKHDLSKYEFSENDLDAMGYAEYDYIYMINCPDIVYTTEKDFNVIFFKNMYTLLSKGGILITRLSDEAIESITNKKTEELISSEELQYCVTDSRITRSRLRGINKSILDSYKHNLCIFRRRISEFMTREQINLELLDESNNSTYISDANINSGDDSFGLHQFLIFKKPDTNSKIKKLLHHRSSLEHLDYKKRRFQGGKKRLLKKY